jgi:dihydrofolate reductase
MENVIIVAIGEDRAIGRKGNLAFYISADLKRFKALTTGHTVVMGRKTFESLPKGALPNRRNIVVTRNPDATFPGAECANSIEAALQLAREAGETEAFIIGGAQIYQQSLSMADRLELTRIDATADDADAFFPEIKPSDWQITAETAPTVDPKSGLTYSFQTLRRHR